MGGLAREPRAAGAAVTTRAIDPAAILREAVACTGAADPPAAQLAAALVALVIEARCGGFHRTKPPVPSLPLKPQPPSPL